MLARIGDIADQLLTTGSAVEASQRFYSVLAPLGATYLQTRVYRRPSHRLTPERHLAAGGVIARIGPPSWNMASDAYRYVCLENNPLLTPVREGWTRYSFGQLADPADRRNGAYWDAISEAGFAEAHCATSYGEGGKISSLHLGFADRAAARDVAELAQLAGLILTERLMMLSDPPQREMVRLTNRERDCLAFVAEGKTDWEISVILGVSEATANFHVDNARRKLDAVNRSQAVAKLAALRLI